MDGQDLQRECSKTAIGFLLMLSLVTVYSFPVYASQEEAATAISSAQNTILNCYDAAKQAESAGASITVLVGTLNKADSLLSEAELAYASENFDAALGLAIQSKNRLNGFIQEANALQQVAEQQQNQDFLINVVVSVLATFVVIGAGFAVWFYVKSKYETSEANEGESARV